MMPLSLNSAIVRDAIVKGALFTWLGMRGANLVAALENLKKSMYCLSGS